MNNFIEFLIILPLLYFIFYLLYRLFKKLFIVFLIPLLLFNFAYADILYYRNLDGLDNPDGIVGETEAFRFFAPVKFKGAVVFKTYSVASYFNLNEYQIIDLGNGIQFNLINSYPLIYDYTSEEEGFMRVELTSNQEIILKPEYVYTIETDGEIVFKQDKRGKYLGFYYNPYENVDYFNYPLGEFYIEDFTNNFSLSNVFGTSLSFLSGGLWILIALALGVMLAVFFAGKSITWIKKALRKR